MAYSELMRVLQLGFSKLQGEVENDPTVEVKC